MSDLAAHLVDDVLPEVPVRQWVCSLPWRLRYAMGYDRRLCADVLGAFIGALPLQPLRGPVKRDHHHSGLALFTPADVFRGGVEQIRAVRQDALDAAYRAHPERFPNGPPRVRLPPSAVHINPLTPEALSVVSDPAAAPDVDGSHTHTAAPSGSPVSKRSRG